MEWKNFFRRNKDKGLSSQSVQPNAGLSETQLEKVHAGVGSTSEEATIAQEEQKDYVETLPKANDALTEEQLEQVGTYAGTKIDGSRSDAMAEFENNQRETIASFNNNYEHVNDEYNVSSEMSDQQRIRS